MRVQAAFIAEQAAQCGYCTNGMIMAAKALLTQTPKPTPEQIKQRARRQPVPLRYAYAHPARRHARVAASSEADDHEHASPAATS